MDDSLFAAQSVASAHRYTASRKALLVNPIRRLASLVSSERAMCRGTAELRAMDDRLLATSGAQWIRMVLYTTFSCRSGGMPTPPSASFAES